ncbi:hypothetical protein TcasGA2_TC005298 [Tribolium castaneum]|uniref:Uncharacterized protein n=1 Tax=Tribolium castaneum TaxID=7070 RepID=D7GYB3_TRICA|nr:hypothetical protein TcasGA2_TC005298 [Tribolium castaneum]
MHLYVCDIQGFCIPEFVVKELTIMDAQSIQHNLFKPSKPYEDIDLFYRKQVKYLERYHHLLRYNDGLEAQKNVVGIIRKFLHLNELKNSESDIIIYVKGYVKEDFLRKILLDSCVRIVNLEKIDESPKLCKTRRRCEFHNLDNYDFMCSLNNAKCIYEWLCTKLIPQ